MLNIIILVVIAFICILTISFLLSYCSRTNSLYKVCPICGNKVKVFIASWAFGKFEYSIWCPNCGKIKYDFGLDALEILDVKEECEQKKIPYKIEVL